MASNTIKYDDPSGYGFVRPVQDGRTSITYPFLMNGDRGACIYTRTIVQTQGSYSPLKPGTEKDDYWPGGDPHAYNMPDSPPEPLGIGDLCRLTRSYARIPGDQITYPPRAYIGKPDYTATAAENPYTNGATNYLTASLFDDLSTLGTAYYGASTGLYTTGDNKVYNPVKVPSAQAVVYATAGTFTLTYKTSTTAALAYNETSANIAAAINALADIITDGITVTVPSNSMANTSTGGGIDISFTAGSGATAITMDATGLTLNIANKNPKTQKISTTYQQIKLPLQITITAHGLSTSLSLAVAWPATSEVLVYTTGNWGSYDANTIWVPGWRNNTVSAQLAGTYASTYSPPATATYAAGIRFPRRRLTEKFYLPGVTAGISAVTDIPVPADLQNTDDFLDALLSAPSGFEVYRVEGPTLWLDGPIYRVAIEELYFPDLV